MTSGPILNMKLDPGERQSAAWISMKAKFEARLEQLRQQNDSPHLTAEQTATLRGHIACLKEVISLDTVPPSVRLAPVASGFPTMRITPGAQNG